MQIKNEHLSLLQTTFDNNRNLENAPAMEKYMRGRFSFIGLKAPERKRLARQFMRELKFNQEPDIIAIIRALWNMPEREYHYVAVDYLVKNKKHLTLEHLDLVEELITTKSWWDTVDAVANHLVGALFLKYPQLIKERGTQWLDSDNMWLKRTMILFQLKYKEETDQELLFSIIEQTCHIDEFFIQKAIGWSLREYSKTNPDAVIRFIENHELSNLAVREGLKWIERQ